MSSLLLLGWALAVTAAVLLLLERRQARERAETVVRACHELRQPLTAMLLLTGRPDGGAPLLAALGPELDRARRAAEDLAGCAERRLGPAAPEPTPIVHVVRDQVRLHDALARSTGRRVRLNARGATAARADRGRLAQALGNALHNALEHGRGDVDVALHASGAGVRVTVRDDGPGVPVAAGRRPRRRGRRGRGLAIAAAAMSAQGGALRVHDGAICLDLPAAVPPGPTRARGGRRGPGVGMRRGARLAGRPARPPVRRPAVRVPVARTAGR